MNKYKKLFQDSYYLMGISKIKLSLIFILFLVSGFLDIVSLALVGPFIAFANEPSAAKQFIFWDYIDEYIFNLSAITNENVILLLGLIIIFTFLVKAITAYFIRLFIAKFSLRLDKASAKVFNKFLSKTPTTCLLTRAGLLNGPIMLKIVLFPIFFLV